MPSIQYFNQSAPFWDFVASFEDRAFKDPGSSSSDEKKDEGQAETGEKNNEGANDQTAEGQTGEQSNANNQQHRSSCGGPNRQRGPWAHGHHGRGGFYGRGGPCGGRRGGGPGGWGGFHPRGGPWDMNPFVQFLESQLNPNQGDKSDINDFSPAVDVFSTPSAYHIHVSLPGAKKEDVGLNYDADKSELSIAGVIYRPGDEEFLKTLAMSERKVGVFDRKVRLGNGRHPAEVDADAITAKLEDGILRIELPRVEKDYVNVKKVDIE